MLRRLEHPVYRLEERVLPMRAFERLDWRVGPVTSIICDDGPLTDLDKVLPVLDEFGVKAVFAVSTQLIGTPGYMNATEVRQLADAGHEIASHMDSHESITARPSNERVQSMLQSKQAIHSMAGVEPTTLVYPYGTNNRDARSQTHEHFTCGVTTWHGLNAGGFNRYAVRRVPFGSYTKPGHNQLPHYRGIVQAAADKRAWLVWMMHTAHPDHDQNQAQHLRRVIDDCMGMGHLFLPVNAAIRANDAVG